MEGYHSGPSVLTREGSPAMLHERGTPVLKYERGTTAVIYLPVMTYGRVPTLALTCERGAPLLMHKRDKPALSHELIPLFVLLELQTPSPTPYVIRAR